MTREALPNLTAFEDSFSDLVKLFEDDNRDELSKYFPIQMWSRFRYVDANGEIKIGIGPCFRWYYKNGPYIGKIDLNKKEQSLIKEIINPLFIKKSANIKKENAPQKHRNDNLFYCIDGLLIELKGIKRDFKNQFYGHDLIVAKNNVNKDIQKLIKCFNNSLEKITPKKSLWFKNLNIDNLDEIIKIVEIHKTILKSARKKGRDSESDNILIYHLVNAFSFFKRDKTKDRKLLFEKNGRIKLKRYWNLICFEFLRFNFYKDPFKKAEKFIKEYRNEPAEKAFTALGKMLQKEYWNFKDRTKIGEFFPTKAYNTGLRKIIFTDNGYQRIDL